MKYEDLFKTLKQSFDSTNDRLVIDSLSIKLTKLPFKSKSIHFLPGAESYYCKEHDKIFVNLETSDNKNDTLSVSDFDIECNRSFNIYLFQNQNAINSKGVIILFHGLNEKSWAKYLPWAYKLVKQTGKTVVLFPLAFHMDRAENTWSDRRQMQLISDQRKSEHNNTHSSFVNAAISSRLASQPERIFWSGCQTLEDFKNFIQLIRYGKIENVSADAGVDIFGYSIGAFFGLFLMMANPGNELSNSKFIAFCGGTVLDRMFPISKYILDMNATINMQSYYAELIKNDFRFNPRFEHFISNQHREQSFFRMILQYNYLKIEREKRIKEISNQIYALALEKDEVVPPEEILNTLKGGYRNIQTKVEILDASFNYDHVQPFPIKVNHSNEIDDFFNEIMERASSFLN